MVGVLNKVDLNPEADPAEFEQSLGIKVLPVSAVTRQGIDSLKQAIIRSAPKDWSAPTIVGASSIPAIP